MLRVLLVLLLFITTACSNKYMVLMGRDGKRAMFRKQTPEFNKRYIEKQRRSNSVKRISEVANNKKTEEKIKFVSDSTAYTNDSVLDKNTVIEEVVKKNSEITKDLIETANNVKTIDDFDYLPSFIFDDPVIKSVVYNKNDTNDLVVSEPVQNEKIDTKVSESKNIKIYEEDFGSNNELVVTDAKSNAANNRNITNSVKDKQALDNVIATTTTRKSVENRDDLANTNDFGSIGSRAEGQIVVENAPSALENNEQKMDNIEVVGVTKKKSWWKFWGNDYEKVETTNVNPSFTHDSENDVPREENVIQEDIEGIKNNDIDANSYGTSNLGESSVNVSNNVNNNVVNTTDNNNTVVLDAKKIDQKEYDSELSSNNKLLNQTAGLKSGKFYVQILSVRNEANCRRTLKKYDIDNKGIVYPVNLDGIMYYRGIIGPFDSLAKAEMEKERIINMGHYDIFIFKEK